MRRKMIGIAAICLAAAVTTRVQAQPGFSMGFKAGQNRSNLSGEGLHGRNLQTVIGGLAVQLKVPALFTVEADALFSTKGCGAAEGSTEGEIRLRYLSIPVVLKKNFFPAGIHPFVLGGVEYSSLLSASDDGVNIKSLVHNRETSVVIGAGIELSLLGKGLSIEGRYDYGLDDVYKGTSRASVKNRVTQIFIGLFL